MGCIENWDAPKYICNAVTMAKWKGAAIVHVVVSVTPVLLLIWPLVQSSIVSSRGNIVDLYGGGGGDDQWLAGHPLTKKEYNVIYV